VTSASLRRFDAIKPSGHGVVVPAFDPAYRSGRTIFGRRVFRVGEVDRLLKSGHNSRKIGKVVTKGPWKGLPIYTLTLEERATCPRDCKAWGSCYGNNMHLAERLVHGLEFEAALEREIDALAARHADGFVVRLHVLGDFYSVGYVEMWRRALWRHPCLRVFGYTARHPQTDPIGLAVYRLSTEMWSRFAVRFSGRGLAERGTSIVDDAGEAADAIVCPAQTGLTDCCATCGLCWQSRRNIAFLRH